MRLPEKIVLWIALAFTCIVLAVSGVIYFILHLDKENTFEDESNPAVYRTDVKEAAKSIYFAVGNGEKYHVEGCTSVSETSERVPVSQKQIDKGTYQPCKKCIN